MVKAELKLHSGKTEVAAAGRIGVAIVAPVIYTDSAGGGNGEYPAPPGGSTISIRSNVPTGARPLCVWWVPLQAGTSFRDHFQAFNLINVDLDPGDVTKLQLSLIGIGGTNGRMRIKIYTLYLR